MARSSKYRSYPDQIKNEIIRTKNPNLFPELKIPRTTALYWIKSSEVKKTTVNYKDIQDKRIKRLTAALKREEALKNLVIRVSKIFPYSFRVVKIKNKSIKRKIVELVESSRSCCKLSDCLKAIGLSKYVYRRWVNLTVCKTSFSDCARRHPKQLTEREERVMHSLVVSPKYAHFSIRSLALYAQRQKLLHCAVETWYKYIKKYNWRRPNKKIIKLRYRDGIRANKPNEIWHIDVTQIKSVKGKRFYLQVIIDNFSRCILSWNLLKKINAENTIRTIKSAQSFANCKMSKIMMDPGTENVNSSVFNHIINSRNLKRLIARVETRYSNSMVEAFFRSLKNNFLYQKTVNGFCELNKMIRFYMNEYNSVVPHNNFSGATPLEIYKGEWEESNAVQMKLNMLENSKERVRLNKLQICSSCLPSQP